MKVVKSKLSGVLVIDPVVHGDDRGFFFESWHRDRYSDAGLPSDFVQDNLSFSRRGTLRGLHFQNPRAQGKLVSVLQGEVFDVAVDLRVTSPTFGEWIGETLSAQNKRQLYIPPGFAHGFCVTSECALFMYKCTDFYDAACEVAIAWDDPDIGIAWPVDMPNVSLKDSRAQRFKDLPRDQLF